MFSSPLNAFRAVAVIGQLAAESQLTIKDVSADERNRLLTVELTGPQSDEVVQRFRTEAIRRTGWDVQTLLAAELSPGDTVTGMIIDPAGSSSHGGGENLPVEAKRVEPRQTALGLVRGASAENVGAIVAAGDSATFARSLARDESFMQGMGKTFILEGEDAVKEAMRRLATSRNPQDIATAADSLVSAFSEYALQLETRIRDMQDQAEYNRTVGPQAVMLAGLILDGWERSKYHEDLLQPFSQLLRYFDPELATTMVSAADSRPAVARDAVQLLFVRLEMYAQNYSRSLLGAAPSDPDAPAGDQVQLSLASFVLKELAGLFQDRTPSRSHIKPLIVENLARMLAVELTERTEEDRQLIPALLGCRGTVKALFDAVSNAYIDQVDGKRKPDSEIPELKEEACGLLLSTAYLFFPHEYGRTIEARYDQASPLLQARYLDAMKFSLLSENGVARERFFSRALVLLARVPESQRHRVEEIVCATLREPGLAEMFLEHIGRENCRLLNALSPGVRETITKKIALPCLKEGLREALPIFLLEVDRAPREALTLEALRAIEADWVQDMETDRRLQLRCHVVELYASDIPDTHREQIERLLKPMSFDAITHLFSEAQVRRPMDQPAAQRLSLLSARLCRDYTPRDAEEGQLICDFLEKEVVKHFRQSVEGKYQALNAHQAVRDKVGELQADLSRVEEELQALGPDVAAIKRHKLYQKLVSGWTTENEKKGDVFHPGELARRTEALKKFRALGDEAGIKAVGAAIETCLKTPLLKDEDNPDFPDSLSGRSLKELITEKVARERELQARQADLNGQIKGLSGGEDVFSEEGTWSQSKGELTETEGNLAETARLSGVEGETLRLFFASPSLTPGRAQKILEQLPEQEPQSALARFVLCIRFGLELNRLGRDVERENDGFEEILAEITGTEAYAPTPEELRLTSKINPGAEFAKVLSRISTLEPMQEELVHLLDGLADTMRSKVAGLDAYNALPVLRFLADRLDGERTSRFGMAEGFGSSSRGAWTSRTNEAALRILEAECQAQNLSPDLVARLDHELRATLNTWVQVWNPPQEAPRLVTGNALRHVEDYLINTPIIQTVPKEKRNARRAWLTSLFLQKVMDSGARFSKAQTEQAWHCLEQAERCGGDLRSHGVQRAGMPVRIGDLFTQARRVLQAQRERFSVSAPSGRGVAQRNGAMPSLTFQRVQQQIIARALPQYPEEPKGLPGAGE